MGGYVPAIFKRETMILSEKIESPLVLIPVT